METAEARAPSLGSLPGLSAQWAGARALGRGWPRAWVGYCPLPGAVPHHFKGHWRPCGHSLAPTQPEGRAAHEPWQLGPAPGSFKAAGVGSPAVSSDPQGRVGDRKGG